MAPAVARQGYWRASHRLHALRAAASDRLPGSGVLRFPKYVGSAFAVERSSKCTRLHSRATVEFPTAEVLEQHSLTPCGLAFFRTEWDKSVSEYFAALDIVEPVYATAQQANKIIKRESRQVPVSRFRLAIE